MQNCYVLNGRCRRRAFEGHGAPPISRLAQNRWRDKVSSKTDYKRIIVSSPNSIYEQVRSSVYQS